MNGRAASLSHVVCVWFWCWKAKEVNYSTQCSPADEVISFPSHLSKHLSQSADTICSIELCGKK